MTATLTKLRVKLQIMATVKEIEESALSLSADELAVFRSWFARFEADAWDRQIEADATAGRLDTLGAEALEDLRAKRCIDR